MKIEPYLKERIVTVLEFFIAKRLHIGIVAFTTSVFCMRAVGVAPMNPWGVGIGALIMWSAYLENLTTDRAEDSVNRASQGVYPSITPTIYRLETFYPYLYLLSLGLSLRVGWTCFLYALSAVAVLVSYVHRVPFLGKRLKEVYIVKNLVPPLGWTLAVAVVPFVASGASFEPVHGLLLAIIFGFHVREEIKFDISDVEGDRAAGIKTLPITLGEAGTRRALSRIARVLSLSLFAALWIVWERGPARLFDTLFVYTLPFFVSILFDDDFVDLLFREKRKAFCNIGIVWWVVLLAFYLVIPFPANVFVFLVLRGAGKGLGGGFVRRLLDLKPREARA